MKKKLGLFLFSSFTMSVTPVFAFTNALSVTCKDPVVFLGDSQFPFDTNEIGAMIQFQLDVNDNWTQATMSVLDIKDTEDITISLECNGPRRPNVDFKCQSDLPGTEEGVSGKQEFVFDTKDKMTFSIDVNLSKEELVFKVIYTCK